jgi:hypothetical protein
MSSRHKNAIDSDKRQNSKQKKLVFTQRKLTEANGNSRSGARSKMDRTVPRPWSGQELDEVRETQNQTQIKLFPKIDFNQ